jgi:hypothetical protein
MGKRATNLYSVYGNLSTRRYNDTIVFRITRDIPEYLFYLNFEFGVIRLVRRLFSNFPFIASASAFSTTSRISFVLKTNLPFIATRFSFLRSSRTSNSSRYSAFSLRRRIFSDYVLSNAAPDRSIYRRTGVSIFKVWRTELTREFTSRSSVPLGGELSRSARSRASVELI